MDGVIIVACGNPIYGNMAFNLAMSIKHNCKIDITCLYSEQSLSELSEKQLSYFDKLIEVPATYYAKSYQRVKCFANELTPYKRTLMIDADTVWNKGKNIHDLFSDSFQTGCLGKWQNGTETHKGYVYWEEPQKIADYWSIDLIYKTYSGFVAFTDKHNKIWKQIQKVYDDDNAPCQKWNGDKPDEYAFNVGISLAKCNMRHDYMPIFFGYASMRYFAYLIKKNFYGASVSGAFPDPYIITVYNSMMREYAEREVVDYKPYVKKGDVLEERKKDLTLMP